MGAMTGDSVDAVVLAEVQQWVAQNVRIKDAVRCARIEATALRVLRHAEEEGRHGTTSDVLDDWWQRIRDLTARRQRMGARP